jgi:hypothetical protein
VHDAVFEIGLSLLRKGKGFIKTFEIKLGAYINGDIAKKPVYLFNGPGHQFPAQVLPPDGRCRDDPTDRRRVVVGDPKGQQPGVGKQDTIFPGAKVIAFEIFPIAILVGAILLHYKYPYSQLQYFVEFFIA